MSSDRVDSGAGGRSRGMGCAAHHFYEERRAGS